MPNDLGMKPEDMGMDSKDMSMDVEDMTPDLPQKDSCEHTTEDGVYGHLGCSLSYQCCDGAWKTRANGCGTCACIEATGKIGCSGS